VSATMSRNEDVADAGMCLLVGITSIGGLAWFYWSVMCSAQTLCELSSVLGWRVR
jgi:hypothetical protein